MTLTVIDPGPQTLIQDFGRTGLAGQGVSTSGAFDRRALRLSHRLLGNSDSAAVFEVLGGGLRIHVGEPCTAAVTGAVGPLWIDDQPVAHGRSLRLRAGSILSLGPFTVGIRAYVGFAGGLEIPPVLGSRSFDTLSSIGPLPVRIGQRFALGAPGRADAFDDVPALLTSGEFHAPVALGPRDDWFTPAAVATFLAAAWEVTSRSDRIGIRLSGPVLERSRSEELPSEPCARGSIQVNAAGQPVPLGPDHPVTGGYPVIAVVLDQGTDLLAQARPGDIIRFYRSAV